MPYCQVETRCYDCPQLGECPYTRGNIHEDEDAVTQACLARAKKFGIRNPLQYMDDTGKYCEDMPCFKGCPVAHAHA